MKKYKTYDCNLKIDTNRDKNRYVIEEDAIIIRTRGKTTKDVIIDIDKQNVILNLLERHIITGDKNYPKITLEKDNKKINIQLVNLIFGDVEEGHVYTYKDENGYNLTDSNVEMISTTEHARRLAVKNKKHKAVGLSYNKKNRKWIAVISVDGNSKYLGSFDTEDEAAEARIIAEEKYWGKVYSKIKG